MRLVSVFACIALLAVAACTTGNSNAGPPLTGAPSRAVKQKQTQIGANLYVANARGSTVTVYDPSTGTLLRTITHDDGIEYPGAILFDGAGNLYVSNYTTVTEYAAGTATLLRTIATGIDGPGALALDALGNLYVANNGRTSEYGQSVTVFAPGQTTPLRAIIAGISGPASLAFDESGTLYVANDGNNTVTQYAGGKKRLTKTIRDGLLVPIGVRFDASQNLYVVNCGLACRTKPSVTEFAPNAKTPIRVITNHIQDPGPLAIAATGNVFVGNGTRGYKHEKCEINEYPPAAQKPSLTIVNDVHNPASMVFDASGNLYVANFNGVCNGKRSGNIAAFAPGATAAFETIGKGISGPTAIGFGP